MPQRVLIVSIDDPLFRTMSSTLVEAGYSPTALPGPDDVMQRLRQSSPRDLVMLDLDFPDPPGLDICHKMRSRPTTANVPIIAVADAAGLIGKVAALEAGADDYVARDSPPDELLACVRALLRRMAPAEADSSRLRAGPIEMQLDRWTVSVDGKSLKLTKKEFRLLQLLLEARGRVLSRDDLLERAWPHGSIHGLDTRTVDVHIGRLRRKLGGAGECIITVRNVGFRCDLQPEWIAGTPPHAAANRGQSRSG